MSKLLRNWRLWFIAMLLLLPFVAICWFIFPSADDYAYTHVARNMDFWFLQKRDYLNWNGRYFSNLLLYLNPLQLHKIIYYQGLSVLLIALLMLSFYYLLFVIKKYYLHSPVHIALPVFVTAFVLIFLPGINEGLFWFTGAATYCLPLILLVLLLSKYLIYFKTKNPVFFKSKIITVLLIIIIAGCNEIAAVTTVLFTFISAAIAYKQKNKNFNLLVMFFVLALVCFLFVLLSPGNTVRALHFSKSFNYGVSVVLAFLAMCKGGVAILQQPSVWFLAAILFIEVCLYDTKIFQFAIAPIYVTIASVMVAYLIYFTAVFGMGINPPMRLHFFNSFILLMLLFGNIVYAADYFREKVQKIQFSFWKIAKRILLVSSVLFLFIDFIKAPGGEWHFKNNLGKVYYDLFSGNAATFRKEYFLRENLIEINKINKKLYICVPEFTVVPQSIFFIDIGTDSNFWVNNATAQYYNLKSIKICKYKI